MTAAAADVTGDTIAAGGSGNIAVTALDATLAADLSGLSSAAGTVTAAFDNSGTFTGNLGTAVVTVADGQTMTLTAARASGKTINEAGGDDATVAVSALELTLDANLSNITTNAVTAAFDDDGTFTGNLGSASVTVASGKTLTANASVLSGKTIAGDGSVIVTDIGADTNLGNVNPNGGVTAKIADGADISGNGNLANVDNYQLGTSDVTMTIAQHGLINSATASDNAVTLSAAGTVTANSAVEIYQLADGAGNDFTTDAVGQTVTGGTGDDTITGVAGNDVILGGDGADTITGGAGEDILTGGDGADTFVFASTDSAADIYSDTDFSGGLTDGDKFVGSFDIVRDFVTGTDTIDIDDSLTFFNTGYVGGEIYVDADNVKPAMTDVPLGFALLIRGEFNETSDQFVVDFTGGVDTMVYFDVAGTNSAIILENEILDASNIGVDFT